MHAVADDARTYTVDMAPKVERNPTTWFGGVRVGRRYVSYYLMPVYVEPALLDDVSLALKRRMQGKSCFNFTRVDEALFAELGNLTRHGYDQTAGDPAWGAARRMDRGMAHRRAIARRG
jgi:hypothetical protein